MRGSNHQNLFDDVTVHITPRMTNGKWRYPIFDGSGAPYWQPGHGAFNTTWNLEITVDGGPQRNEPVRLEGLDEGPDARIVGMFGNREFSLDYRPEPVLRSMNQPVLEIPSLYHWQLRARQEDAEPSL